MEEVFFGRELLPYHREIVVVDGSDIRIVQRDE